MTRAELEHAIRAACDVSGDHHDLAASKLIAFRDKDKDFVRTLLVEKLIDPSKLRRRLDQLSNNPRVKPELLAVIKAWVSGVLKDIGKTDQSGATKPNAE